MSKRMDIFKNYETHAWFGRLYKKLSKEEIGEVERFINEHDKLSKGEFEYAINRMYTTGKNLSKNWSIIQELLSCVNSAYKGE